MKVSELRKAIEGIPDDAEVMVNIEGTTCKPARMFGAMAIAPSGYNQTVSGYAIVVDIDGEPHQIEGSKITYKLDESKRMAPRNPDGRFADL